MGIDLETAIADLEHTVEYFITCNIYEKDGTFIRHKLSELITALQESVREKNN